MLTLEETRRGFRELAANSARSNLRFVVKEWMRERVNPEREKRIHFPKSMYQKLYDQQGGKCPRCPEPLLIPARKNEIDHRDPNRQDFNHRDNLALMHPHCNKKKSSKSLLQQSKETGENFTDLQ